MNICRSCLRKTLSSRYAIAMGRFNSARNISTTSPVAPDRLDIPHRAATAPYRDRKSSPTTSGKDATTPRTTKKEQEQKELDRRNSQTLRLKCEHLLVMNDPASAERLLVKSSRHIEEAEFAWNSLIRYYAIQGTFEL